MTSRVEGRPDEVDADPHRARAGAAVAARGGVADLVERAWRRRRRRTSPAAAAARRSHGATPARCRDRGTASRRARGSRATARPSTGGQNSGRTTRGQRARDALGDDRRAELQREQRVRPLERGARPVGGGKHAERAQLLLDEEPDVVGADLAADVVRDGLGDRAVVALPVGGLGDAVEQLGELERLPVGAAGEVRRLLKPEPSYSPISSTPSASRGGGVVSRSRCRGLSRDGGRTP